MSIVLALGWMVPYGTDSVHAAEKGTRGAEGIRISAGADHSLLIKPDGTVVAWGNNVAGRTEVPSGLKDVTAVAAGFGHSLALTADGVVVAWGNGGNGRTAVPAEATSGEVTAIAAGGSHSLALLSNGTVIGWGGVEDFPGDGIDQGQANVPAGLTDVIAISAGYVHSLALKSDGTVVAWGNISSTVPGGLDNVVAISAGTWHSLALKSDGTVIAWGNNNDGQSTIPAELALGGVVAISAGDHHSLALKSDGTVVAWGANTYGQTTVPSGLTDVVAISAGWDFSLALKSDGTLVAWGDNSYHQTDLPTGLSAPIKGEQIASYQQGFSPLALKSNGTVIGWGNNSDGQINIPNGLSGVVGVASGYLHSLALKSDGTVVGWGNNNKGQAQAPATLDEVVAISGGGLFSLALKSDGTVVAWGDNSFGQTDVPSDLDGVAAVSAGHNYSLALKADGTVVAWGYNNYGQTTVPTGLDGVAAISAGVFHSLALKSDGTVVAWGIDEGPGGRTDVPASLNGVVAIAAGYYHSLALKSDGTVVAWGNNDNGQTDVPAGLNKVVAITAGPTYSLALKADGSVVAWGSNNEGEKNIPGNANLDDLELEEGPFTKSFDPDADPATDPDARSYKYYYDGYSPTSVHVMPTLTNSYQTDLYVNNELLPVDSDRTGTKTINIAGATSDTVIPVRVEPYLLPSQTYTITLEIDSTSPDVQFGTDGSSTPATSASSTVTVSDTQSGVDNDSLQYAWTQSTSEPEAGEWTDFDNGDTLSQTSGDGNWYLHIRATDAVGNTTANAVSHRFVLDNTAPSATVSSSASGTVNAAFPVTITFSEGVSGVALEDLTVANGVASDLASVSSATYATTYTATITPTTSRQNVTVSIDADAAMDALGHGNTASNTLTLMYDTTKPVVAFGGFTDLQTFAAPPTEVSVSVSEAVYWIADGTEPDSANALPLIGMTRNGDAFSAYTPSYDETSHTFTISFDDVLADGVYEVSVAGGVVENDIHNSLDAASASFTVAVPVIADLTISTARLPSGGGDISITLTGVNLTGQTVQVYVDGVEVDTAAIDSDTSATATVSLPANTAYSDKDYAITVYLNGVEVAGQSATAAVSARPIPVASLSGNADLTDMTVSAAGTGLVLSPAFAPETTQYTVESDAEQIELRVTPAHPNAIVALQGERIGEKTTIPLTMGANALTITVRAEDGTLKTYTLTVTRTDASDATVPECAFTDIKNHWAENQICEAAELGIVEGVGAYTFVPNGYVTRTEFAVMLLRTLELPLGNESNELVFSDKASIPEWARLAMQSAKAEGVTDGYPDGTLRPLQTVNRSEMAAMVAKTMGWEATSQDSPSFSDAAAIPGWARGYIEAVREHGIVEGRDGNEFMPAGLTTRAEAAVVLLRLWHTLH
ncbi:RCC1 domain-containing protein [Cohnella fermenti]|uniref:SLH domain-containing protein n=1 Tax=Cohnella fermenti TaxID=2565925 RepID=A0A4S4BQ59_9BACL|nr:S-layer homology domain-containing protein [Cohnella fermenti]THF77060.1 hypothetical protein E6C55_16965 [Cohnella fermenti]